MKINFIDKKLNEENSLSHKSILILGKGSSEYKNLKIIFPKNIKKVESSYGEDSQLTKAYIEAVRAGATEIYVCNCFKYTDYIKALELIAQNDFAFICPLFSLSTTYIRPDTKDKVYFAEMYAEALEYSFSNLIMTEKHASLYENISHYLLTMKSISQKFKQACSYRSKNLECMAFTLNNLKDYDFANVVLAALIAESSLRTYPKKELGEVIFDINKYDTIGNEFSYFSYDILAGTNVENLLNYQKENNVYKMLLINVIKNRINMALDYDQFSGCLINSYTKIRINSYTKEILNSFVGIMIEEFDILDIVYENQKGGQVDINIYLSIKPFASIEFIDIKIEV